MAALLSLLFASAVAAAILGRLHQLPLWLAFAVPGGAAVVAAVGAAASTVLRDWLGAVLGRRPAQDRVLRDGYLLGRRGRAPHAGQVDLRDLGVHPAALPDHLALPAIPAGAQPAYVPRDGDGELASALGGAQLVVVQGRSASGKTRMAAEVMRRRFQRRLLLAPRDGKALRDLAEVGLPLSNAVVWLDDLERFAGPNGLDTVLLNRLCPPGGTEVVLLATLRDEERAAVDNEIDRLLRLATTVRVSFEWTADERERARQRRSDPWIADWLDHGERTGLAEHVAAGPAVLERWQSGRNGGQLAAAALVSAAIDCRRAGLVEAVPGTALLELSREYLDPRDAYRPGAPDIGDRVAWATTPVRGGSSCLIPDAGDRYRAFDYLVDHVQHDPAAGQVPLAVWRWAAANADDCSFVFGAAARSVIRAAAGLTRIEAGSGSIPDSQAEALRVVLPIFAERLVPEAREMVEAFLLFAGLLDDFIDWITRYVDSDDVPGMTELTATLRLLGESDDGGDGESALRRAAERGNSAAGAALGELLAERNRTAEARPWLELAVQAGSVGSIPPLAWILHREGDGKGLEDLLEAALAAGHLDPACEAGIALARSGDKAEAERWFRRAADAGYAPAMTLVGDVLYERKDRDGARAWYERGAGAGDVPAMVNLGFMQLDAGNLEAAEASFRPAAERGHRNGMFGLGRVLSALGRDDGAERWYRAAAEAGVVDAMYNLGLLLTRDGNDNDEEAASWFRRAGHLGHVEAASRLLSLVRLGRVSPDEPSSEAAQDPRPSASS